MNIESQLTHTERGQVLYKDVTPDEIRAAHLMVLKSLKVESVQLKDPLMTHLYSVMIHQVSDGANESNTRFRRPSGGI